MSANRRHSPKSPTAIALPACPDTISSNLSSGNAAHLFASTFKLWGIVAGGWLMARAAEIAAAKLAAGAGDAAFCTTKIATARFYVEHILPQAPALAEEITGGAASVLAFDSAAF